SLHDLSLHCPTSCPELHNTKLEDVDVVPLAKTLPVHAKTIVRVHATVNRVVQENRTVIQVATVWSVIVYHANVLFNAPTKASEGILSFHFIVIAQINKWKICMICLPHNSLSPRNPRTYWTNSTNHNFDWINVFLLLGLNLSALIEMLTTKNHISLGMPHHSYILTSV
ncbi:unnamed protein product, partial [Adineta ricciae]